jgi:hypothetical protein
MNLQLRPGRIDGDGANGDDRPPSHRKLLPMTPSTSTGFFGHAVAENNTGTKRFQFHPPAFEVYLSSCGPRTSAFTRIACAALALAAARRTSKIANRIFFITLLQRFASAHQSGKANGFAIDQYLLVYDGKAS